MHEVSLPIMGRCHYPYSRPQDVEYRDPLVPLPRAAAPGRAPAGRLVRQALEKDWPKLEALDQVA